MVSTVSDCLVNEGDTVAINDIARRGTRHGGASCR
jgi:hypothetical protein